MGLRQNWIMVADVVGFDAFILMWQTLSANEELLDARNRVTIPSLMTYLRFQRNNLIRSLAATGAGAREICESLRKDHKMDVQLSAVRWVLRKMRSDAGSKVGAEAA